MFMQHRVLRKGINPRTMPGSFENIFGMLSIGIAASGDDWRLGDTGSALVLCQVMPISNEECYIMSVAVSEDQAAVGIIDSVNEKIRGTQGL
jgi:hypothetical protein